MTNWQVYYHELTPNLLNMYSLSLVLQELEAVLFIYLLTLTIPNLFSDSAGSRTSCLPKLKIKWKYTKPDTGLYY